MNWNALTTGTADKCPRCASPCLRLAQRQELPHSLWPPLTTLRKCEECALVFEPPAHMRLIIAIGLFGAAMAISSIVFLVTGIPLVEQSATARVVGIALGLLAMWGALTLMGSAWNGLRARRTLHDG